MCVTLPPLPRLQKFEAMVLEDLWKAICFEFPPPPPPLSALEFERSFHQHFVEDRSRQFVGRRALIQRLCDMVDKNETESLPIVVIGQPGSGKTSLVTAFSKHYAMTHPACFVLVHVVSASPTSTDIREVLLRLCRELEEEFDLATGLDETDYQTIREVFARTWLRVRGRVFLSMWVRDSSIHTNVGECGGSAHAYHLPRIFTSTWGLGLGSGSGLALGGCVCTWTGTLEVAGRAAKARRRHVLLVIDAVNQLSNFFNAHTMDWFPTIMPAGVHALVSTVPDASCLAALGACVSIKCVACVQYRHEAAQITHSCAALRSFFDGSWVMWPLLPLLVVMLRVVCAWVDGMDAWVAITSEARARTPADCGASPEHGRARGDCCPTAFRVPQETDADAAAAAFGEGRVAQAAVPADVLRGAAPAGTSASLSWCVCAVRT